jgi:tetratricopeptide (TPR) repeat protein/2-polyprenyl-3-methyl-5-hydroxy-6-metoxy-1,4-benzoquinol methylase
MPRSDAMGQKLTFHRRFATSARPAFGFWDTQPACYYSRQSSDHFGLTAQIGFFAVNRKQRRMAAKMGRQAVPPAPGASVGPSVRPSELLDTAPWLKRPGKLDEAVARYRWALALEPNNADAHYNLGNVLRQQSKFDEAEIHYQRAVVLKPTFAEAHNNLGNVLRRQGKSDEAATHYQQAVALKPNFADAHINLGNALLDQGRADEAASQYHRAMALNPGSAEAHGNLANVLNWQGRLDEAVVEYQRALALKPDFAEAHNNLGTAFRYQGKTAEAVEQYRRALTLAPNYADAYSNLGVALLDAGDPAQALQAIQRSIKIGESENSKLLFVECLRNLNFIPDAVDLRNDLIRALSEPWGRPSDLVRFVAIFLKRTGTTSVCIRRLTSALPRRLPAQELFSPAELAEICEDRLLRCLLETAIVCDIEFERFLTAARQMMLEATSARVCSRQVEEVALPFFCALAQQCFVNEYIFVCTDHDNEQADRLRARLIEALASGASIPELWLVAVAAFSPLASLQGADLLGERRWSAPVAQLVARHLRDGQEERQLQATVPRLTTIEDAVSLAVKQQYEESPYPRWMKAAPVGKPTTINACLRGKFPLIDLRSVGKRSGAKILVAGCGTGQHSIETARRFSGAQVLAIDLSLTSLCYAQRKTQELGLNNIEYAQADIMRLQSIGRTFDIIEASGVLHHLADPMAGWRELLAILKQDGFMRLGLYSELARRDLSAARTFIAQRGYGPTAPEIRRCREELTGFGDDTPLTKATEWIDFYSTSTCRDLLFHVQEHQLNLPEIGSFLRENRLDFLGFDLPGQVLQSFRRRFPSDKTMTDLELWHIFETENPSTFVGMYQFWIRKAYSAGSR